MTMAESQKHAAWAEIADFAGHGFATFNRQQGALQDGNAGKTPSFLNGWRLQWRVRH